MMDSPDFCRFPHFVLFQMIQRLLIVLSSLPLCYGLYCYQCGVFLSAPTSECQGAPKNISCDPDNYGCLSIHGKNKDGTYYVEKRCAEKADKRTDGCTEITVQG
ncbi:hypothetical protein ANCCAN_04095 [Ancylostoma caninum]|uniref:Uncharacterized protein n=1 Tax=Ancylostoma caninum TaxID=29170 RepID=A0A368H3L2_ANCCA|nr:hypothetical protein ANCCAN_04095 [Ancylostoma caninum]